MSDLSSPSLGEGELGLAGIRSEVCAGGVIFQNSLLRPLAADVRVKP